MVEPNSNEVGGDASTGRLDIWDPEEFYSTYGGTLYDWNQFHPRISSAVREVDANTPILIGGMAYSAVAWLPYLVPTGDQNTVYTVHQYEPHVYTHAGQFPFNRGCVHGYPRRTSGSERVRRGAMGSRSGRFHG